MIHLPDPASAKRWCEQQRRQNLTIGYVPTMGALHPGHLSLVERSLKENDCTCVSIFVNPLQFNRSEDLNTYPQNLIRDQQLLESAGCTMAYTGTLQGFFPDIPNITSDISQVPKVDPGPAARGLEASHRPGHLEGVYLIVERLFSTVGDCRAYFGEKDFQQTLVVKTLAERMAKPYPARGAIRQTHVEVIVCPTVREANGLAMSSRNERLTKAQRALAGKLYKALQAAKSAWLDGEWRPGQLESLMLSALKDDQIRVEYGAIRDPKNWTPQTPTYALNQAQALVAAWISDVRLIDNLQLHGDNRNT